MQQYISNIPDAIYIFISVFGMFSFMYSCIKMIIFIINFFLNDLAIAFMLSLITALSFCSLHFLSQIFFVWLKDRYMYN